MSVNETKAFRVGLFIIFSLFLASVIFYWFNGALLSRYYPYYLEVQHTKGVVPKTPVYMNGVRVGEVGEIFIESNSVRMLLKVRRDVAIPKNIQVVFATRGMLGESIIQIQRPENPSADLFPPGSTLPLSPDGASFDQLLKTGGEIFATIHKWISNLPSDQNPIASAHDILLSMKNISERMEFLLQDKGIIENTLNNLETMMAKYSSSSHFYDQRIRNILSDIQSTTQEIKRLFALSENSPNALASLAHTFHNLRETTETLKTIVHDIEKGQGTLGTLIRNQEVAENIKNASNKISSFINDVEQIELTFEYQGTMSFFHSNIQPSFPMKNQLHQANLFLKTTPKRFYVLGLTNGGRSQARWKVKNGIDENYEYIYSRSSLGLNVMIGYQVSDVFRVRGGILDNRFAGLLEFDLNRFPLCLGLEIRDFKDLLYPYPYEKEFGPLRLDVWVRWKPIENWFFVVGLERFIQLKKPVGYVGLGFSFQDPMSKDIIKIGRLFK